MQDYPDLSCLQDGHISKFEHLEFINFPIFIAYQNENPIACHHLEESGRSLLHLP
jgi:hypothetical protein